MSILPGQRSVVFVSYGVNLDDGLGGSPDLFDLTDQAIRDRVVINTLDARALDPQAPGADFGLAEHGIKQPEPHTTGPSVPEQLETYRRN